MKKVSNKPINIANGTVSVNSVGFLTKKKTKTMSSSFTPQIKSSGTATQQLETIKHVTTQRHSIDPSHIIQSTIGFKDGNKTSVSSLALDKHIEYNQSNGQVPSSAQNSQIISVNLHKPNKTQLPLSVDQVVMIGTSQKVVSSGGAGINHRSGKLMLKNKVAFEKFHPSQHIAQNRASDYSHPSTYTVSKPYTLSSSSASNTHATGTTIARSPAVVASKLSQYQKMARTSTSPTQQQHMTSTTNTAKRTTPQIRRTAKKNSISNQSSQNQMPRASVGLGYEVKKSCSSQSLMKIQAAQLISAQMKEMSRKTLGVKKSQEGSMSTANIASSFQNHQQQSQMAKQPVRRVIDQSKKPAQYFASFSGQQPKQNNKVTQKVTPPNKDPSNTLQQLKPTAANRQHRRVQSHGQVAMHQMMNTFDTTTQQSFLPSQNLHNTNEQIIVEKAQTTGNNVMESSVHTVTLHEGSKSIASSNNNNPLDHQQLYGNNCNLPIVPNYHPSLAKQHNGQTSNNIAQNHHNQPIQQLQQHPSLDKSQLSGTALSQSSLNGSREQVSILSLSSFTRSTPKFLASFTRPQAQQVSQSKQMSRVVGKANHYLNTSNYKHHNKALSPQATAQGITKQSQQTSSSSKNMFSIKEKKRTASDSVPNEMTALVTSPSATTKPNNSKNTTTQAKHASKALRMKQTATVGRLVSPTPNSNNVLRVPQQQYQTPKQIQEQLSQLGNAAASAIMWANRNQETHTKSVEQYQTTQTSDQKNSQVPLQDQPRDPSSQIFAVNQQTGPHHLKSQSQGQSTNSISVSNNPGIYKMYMGQSRQLKKQSKMHAIQKTAQPSQFISFNADASTNQQVHSHASLESLQKNTSLMQTRNSRIVIPTHGKAPTKLQLTTPPSAHIERSGTEINSPNHKSISSGQEQNVDFMQKTDSSLQLTVMHQMPQSMTDLQANSLTAVHKQNQRPQIQQIEILPNTSLTRTVTAGGSTTHLISQGKTNQNLTVKHKLLAKAIKQHHETMAHGIYETGQNTTTHGGYQAPPKTLSNDSSIPLHSPVEHPLDIIQGQPAQNMMNYSNHTTSGPNILKQANSTLSPKFFNSTINATIEPLFHGRRENSPPHHQGIPQKLQAIKLVGSESYESIPGEKQLMQNFQNNKAKQILHKRQSSLPEVNQSNHPLTQQLNNERQHCWQSPRIAISYVSDGIESPKNDTGDQMAGDIGGGKFKNYTLQNQDTTQGNNQLISAGIINKIQNNYKVQVTNISGYESAMTTASAHALHQITQKLKNGEEVPHGVLPYLHALQEISEVYPSNGALNTLLSSVHAGISTQCLTKEGQIQKSHESQSQRNLVIGEMGQKLKQASDQIQNLERNETETRRNVKKMASQIDQRDNKIEILEKQIMEHQKRARLMFKKQMKSKAERPQLDLLFDGNCSELERQSDEHHKVFQENQDLQSAVDELNEDMAYGKQRENKLMFFLYILKQMGYPISEVFEREIKDVPTSRFSKNFDDEYNKMHAQLWKERKEVKKEALLLKQNGFGVDRDEVLFEQVAKTDRVVPIDMEGRFIHKLSQKHMTGPMASLCIAEEDEDDLNFYPLQVGPILAPVKPDFVPSLDIDKALLIKIRRAKGLSVAHLVNRQDSFDQKSQSSDEESLDSRGRPKRCPKPRIHKRILDQYGISTGARNILELESRIFKERYEAKMLATQLSDEVVDTDNDNDNDLYIMRYSLNSQRAESLQSMRL